MAAPRRSWPAGWDDRVGEGDWGRGDARNPAHYLRSAASSMSTA